jgi:DNA-binding IclR family transcriptional regulator
MTDHEIIPPANAIERVVGAIEMMALADQPLRLSEIAQQLGIPKSALHRILTSLTDRGWVEQSHNDSYSLTLRMPLLGQRMLSKLSISNLRQPILDRLAERTRELVRLTEIRKDALVWIGSARSRRSGLVYEADMTEPVVPFATANGKAWLASLPVDRAIRIALDAGMGTRLDLPRAVSSVEALVAELEQTRQRGYGLALEEAEEGVAAIATTIGAGSGVVGTMSVAAPIGRLGPARIAEILPDLRKSAQSMLMVWNTPLQVPHAVPARARVG